MPSLPGRVVVLKNDPVRRRRLAEALSGGVVVAVGDVTEAHEELPASAVVVSGVGLALLEAAHPEVPIVGADNDDGPPEAVAARAEAAHAKRWARAPREPWRPSPSPGRAGGRGRRIGWGASVGLRGVRRPR